MACSCVILCEASGEEDRRLFFLTEEGKKSRDLPFSLFEFLPYFILGADPACSNS